MVCITPQLAVDAAQEAFSVAKATIRCRSNPRSSRQLDHAANRVVDTHNLSLSIPITPNASPTWNGCLEAAAVDALHVPFTGSIAQSSIACRDMPCACAEQLTVELIEVGSSCWLAAADADAHAHVDVALVIVVTESKCGFVL